MPLQEYKGYTVDYRLKQFRKVVEDWGVPIEFIEFDSERGDEILCEMIAEGLLDYSKYQV